MVTTVNCEAVETRADSINCEAVESSAHSILTDDFCKFLYELYNSVQTDVLEVKHCRKLEFNRCCEHVENNPVTGRFWDSIDAFYHKGADDSPTLRSSDGQARRVRSPRLGVHFADVDPSNSIQFAAALRDSYAQGIQVEFDDGFIPTVSKVLIGHENLRKMMLVRYAEADREDDQDCRSLMDWRDGKAPTVVLEDTFPDLFVRPRAWNMDDYMVVIGEDSLMPGALVDTFLFYFHSVRHIKNGSSAYMYLPKLEHSREAKLWRKVFLWCESKLQLPPFSVKVVILVESVQALYDLDAIVQALDGYIIGINLGGFDFLASIGLRHSQRMLNAMPEQADLSITHPLLRRFYEEVHRVAQVHGLALSGGMIGKFPTLLPSMNEETREEVYAEFMESAKRSEIEFGFNAFLVYDPVDDNPGFEMSRWATDLLGRCKPKDERYFPDAVDPPLPKSPTTSQLEYNCEVLVMYCLNWVYRQTGSYVLKGLVEDSATAEIARAKLLDWSRRSLSLRWSTWMATLSVGSGR
eukprot:GHVH01002725.1.p1 GENE.GHVH01002725.1~~GHVH01002725.1.p1  ORF type:complete len:523 (+),score=71.77 GHVH01002725.1:52-1620(+)